MFGTLIVRRMTARNRQCPRQAEMGHERRGVGRGGKCLVQLGSMYTVGGGPAAGYARWGMILRGLSGQDGFGDAGRKDPNGQQLGFGLGSADAGVRREGAGQCLHMQDGGEGMADRWCGRCSALTPSTTRAGVGASRCGGRSTWWCCCCPHPGRHLALSFQVVINTVRLTLEFRTMAWSSKSSGRSASFLQMSAPVRPAAPVTATWGFVPVGATGPVTSCEIHEGLDLHVRWCPANRK